MLGNIRMLSTMGYTHITLSAKRKKYAYGNKNYSIRKSRDEIYKMMKLFSNRMIKAAKMDLQVLGRENLPKEGPVLYIANHKSIFDIVVLVSVIEETCIFIGKKEVSNMPLINKWFDALGAIYIDREDKRQTLERVMQGINELKNGQSIVVFPEGTRISGDDIAQFKGGCFKLATKTGVPIVPIAIRNTHKVFEDSRSIQKATVTMNIGKPIDVKALTNEEVRQLPSRAEEIVKDLMQEIISR